MADATEGPDKRPRNRFSHLFDKSKRKTKQYTNEQFEALRLLYKRDLALREFLYHNAPITIIKRQSALVSDIKASLPSLGLSEEDLLHYADKHWLDVLDNDMDARLREKCPFWREYAKKMQATNDAEQPCSGPCLGLFCPKRKTTKLKRGKRGDAK